MIHIATDAWTSPNDRPYVAFTIHLLRKGKAASMILDIVEVKKRHTGVNLAEVTVNVLREFGIQDKVSEPWLRLHQKLTLSC